MHKPLINISPYQVFGFCLAITFFELLTYMASDMIMPAMLTVMALSPVAAKTLVFCSEGSPENFYPGVNTTGTFNVTRAYDEALGIDTPRIWTAERDRQMWELLQG